MADFTAIGAYLKGGIHSVPLPEKFIEMPVRAGIPREVVHFFSPGDRVRHIEEDESGVVDAYGRASDCLLVTWDNPAIAREWLPRKQFEPAPHEVVI